MSPKIFYIFNHKQSFDLKVPEKSTVSYRNQILATIGCAIVHLSTGLMFGFTAVTLPGMMNPPPDEPLKLTEEEATLFVAGNSVGGLVGSLASSLLLFHFGQRKMLLICIPLQSIFWVWMSQAQQYWSVVMCRVLMGFMNGILDGASTAYVTEICIPDIRVRMISSLDLLRQVGLICVYLIGSFHLTWRDVALICGVIYPLPPMIILFFLPDSPRWLATKHLYKESEKALVVFRGDSYNITEEFGEIVDQLSEKELTMLDQVKLLRNKSLAIVFFSMLAVDVLINFSGGMVIQSYSALIFTAATEHVDAYLSTIIGGCTRVLGCLLFFLLAERINRRTFFLVPFGTSLTLVAALGVYFFYRDEWASSVYMKWMPVLCVTIYYVFYTISLSAISCIENELLPTEFRSFGIGLIVTTWFLGAFAAGASFFAFVKTFTLAGTFWAYSLLGLSVFLLVFFFLPETRGKSLENINVMKSEKELPT